MTEKTEKIFCDYCGKEILKENEICVSEKYTTVILNTEIVEMYVTPHTIKKDICDDCNYKLVDFIDSLKNKE